MKNDSDGVKPVYRHSQTRGSVAFLEDMAQILPNSVYYDSSDNRYECSTDDSAYWEDMQPLKLGKQEYEMELNENERVLTSHSDLDRRFRPKTLSSRKQSRMMLSNMLCTYYFIESMIFQNDTVRLMHVEHTIFGRYPLAQFVPEAIALLICLMLSARIRSPTALSSATLLSIPLNLLDLVLPYDSDITLFLVKGLNAYRYFWLIDLTLMTSSMEDKDIKKKKKWQTRHRYAYVVHLSKMMILSGLCNSLFPLVELTLFHLLYWNVILGKLRFHWAIPAIRAGLGVVSFLWTRLWISYKEIMLDHKGTLLKDIQLLRGTNPYRVIKIGLRRMGRSAWVFFMCCSWINHHPFTVLYLKYVFHQEGRLMSYIFSCLGVIMGGIAVLAIYKRNSNSQTDLYWSIVQVLIGTSVVRIFLTWVSLMGLPYVDKDDVPLAERHYVDGYQGDELYRTNVFHEFSIDSSVNGCAELQRYEMYRTNNIDYCNAITACVSHMKVCAEAHYYGKLQTGFISTVILPDMLNVESHLTFTTSKRQWLPILSMIISGAVQAMECILILLLLSSVMEDKSAKTTSIPIVAAGLFLTWVGGAINYSFDLIPSLLYRYQFVIGMSLSVVGYIGFGLHLINQTVWAPKS